MPKNFQEITLTTANLTQSMVSPPGILTFSGTPDSATVLITLTNDAVAGPNSVPLSIPGPLSPIAFANPILAATITASTAFNVLAQRLTFTASGGGGSESITIRWYPVLSPF